MVCLTVLLQHGYVFLGIVFHVVFVFFFFFPCVAVDFTFFLLLLSLCLCFYSVLLVASVFVGFCYSRFWIGVVKCFHAKIDFLDLS